MKFPPRPESEEPYERRMLHSPLDGQWKLIPNNIISRKWRRQGLLLMTKSKNKDMNRCTVNN